MGDNLKIIGVTGGIGAGKSTVLAWLHERYRAKVLEADRIGHEVMEPGTAVYRRIVELYGTSILTEDQRIDRGSLGAIVFSDREKLKKLNGVIHPAVKEEILRRIDKAREKNETYVVVEAALFLEENYDVFCDETWYIYTNEETRAKRLKESRGYTKERIAQIFANQKRHEEFLSRCEVVIDNNGTPDETRQQIDRRMKKADEIM